jgi:hypothetical protein
VNRRRRAGASRIIPRIEPSLLYQLSAAQALALRFVHSFLFLVCCIAAAFFAGCCQELQRLPAASLVREPHNCLVVYELILMLDASGKVHLLRHRLIVGILGRRALPSTLMVTVLAMGAVAACSLHLRPLLLSNVVLLRGTLVAVLDRIIGGNQKWKVGVILGL